MQTIFVLHTTQCVVWVITNKKLKFKYILHNISWLSVWVWSELWPADHRVVIPSQTTITNWGANDLSKKEERFHKTEEMLFAKQYNSDLFLWLFCTHPLHLLIHIPYYYTCDLVNTTATKDSLWITLILSTSYRTTGLWSAHFVGLSRGALLRGENTSRRCQTPLSANRWQWGVWEDGILQAWLIPWANLQKTHKKPTLDITYIKWCYIYFTSTW